MGEGTFFSKKGEVGKIVEESRLLRENNLCLLANLCAYKFKKHYNPRYIKSQVTSFIIYQNFWDKFLKLASAILISFLFFHQMIALQKL